jgi:hypothetical protein
VLSLAIAVFLGIAIIGSKVGAQNAGDRKKNAAAPATSASAAPAPAPAAAKDQKDKGPKKSDKSDKADKSDKSDKKGGKDDKKDDDQENPVDYAEVQTEADFPATMTDEEKTAVGTGKVPIHREGPFKSPFAHPHFGGPATAKVGVVLVTMREYDIQHGSFEADFFLSLTSDRPMGAISLMFPNANESNETVLIDTPTFKLFRYDGKFVSPVDLRKYPFDTQELFIEVEDQRAGVDQLIFEANQSRTSVDEGFELPGWSVAAIGAKAYKHRYPPRFDRDDLYVSRYKLTLSIDRFVQSAAFSVFVPAYIIVLISLFGLWVPPDELEVRTNAGAPMLAAAVFFHYSLTQSLPATGYLTRADKLMLGVYAALLINMATTWVFLLVKDEDIEHWFKLFRAWVPPATMVLMAIVTFI